MKKVLSVSAIVCLMLLAFTPKATSKTSDNVVLGEVCMKCTGDPNGTFTCEKIKCPKL